MTNLATSIDLRPVELLQALLRYDTSNPPGNEYGCLEYIRGVLAGAGIESQLIARTPDRPNLIARISGRGAAPPLLLYGHVDVVPAGTQTWHQPPFAGHMVDGEVWGRGALDMKGGVAMLVSAFLRTRSDRRPAGDLILALTSDEETGSEQGARYLVEEYADLFVGARYAIGEVGGFTQHVAGRRFYPIQVAEKQACTLKVTFHGPGGHGSVPLRGTAAAKLGRMLATLDSKRLPVHITPVVRSMLGAMAAELPLHHRLALRPLLSSRLSNAVLRVLGSEAADLDPLLHNTVSATIIRGGESWNVIPDQVAAELDGRLLPGQCPQDLVAELKTLLPDSAEIEMIRSDPPPPAEPDMALFPLLAEVIRRADPGGFPIPMLLPGVTDARFFARLGIQTYGFLPMRLPKHITTGLIHAPDERVPASAIQFGADAIFEAIRDYGEGAG